jgi:hypothetical protein
MDPAVIFLGPSLPVASARSILEADYRPPVRRGDIEALRRQPARIVGIIDGEFFQSLAISPKEILAAIRDGFTVFGSSSMGALRAVELERYGMIGIGTVFELYRSGHVDGDDEVAVVFSGSDGRPLSLPLVNMRVALRGAVDAGLLTPQDRTFLLRRLKALYFPERDYAAVLRIARTRLPEAPCRALESYLEERAPDAKRDDAIKLLEAVKAHVDGNGRR